MADETLLVISGFGVAPYSARGLTQTLDPIDASAVFRRNVNGVLQDLSEAQFRKYITTITCSDAEAPALNGVWPGQQVTVDCVAELGYTTIGGAPAKTVVSGSSRVEGLFTYYRPQLIMLVKAFNTSRDEYGHVTSWSLTLEEK